MPKSLYQPAGLDQPEVCFCGHYSYIHGRYRCGAWAHPEHSFWGRLRLGRFVINAKCPCLRYWLDGYLHES